MVREADDAHRDVKRERAGQRVRKRLTACIETKRTITVNRRKSAVAKPNERPCLGFRFTGGPEITRRSAPHALARVKKQIRKLTNRNRGRSLETVVAALSRSLKGWGGDVGFCQTPSVLQDLDAWIRRRVRGVIWTQGTRPRRRLAEWSRRGVQGGDAASTAMSSRGPWRLSHRKAVHVALPNSHFTRLGLPRLGGMGGR